MLSNTAIPKYYSEFRKKVISGKIPVNKEISLEMNRIDALIADPNIYCDNSKVEGWIKYCESELTLTDGADVELVDSFKLWGEQIFCWYYFIDKTIFVPGQDGQEGSYIVKRIKRRLINKQLLIVGRSAAKSLYMSFIQSYFQNIDTSTTYQITTAPTMKQADEVMSPIRTALIRAKGPLFAFLTEGSKMNTKGSYHNRAKLLSTKKGIENFLTGSVIEIRPMRIDKLQGLRVKVATVDEWLSGDVREDVIGAIEQGAAKIPGYIIIAASSEGTVRNGAGDTIKMELTDILKGDYINPHVSIWWYKLDDINEVNNPNMWLKANPNLGITVSYDTYMQEVERAEKVPSARNDILAKRFGLPMEGFTYFFTWEETLVHDVNVNPAKFWRMPCTLGIDLSQGADFCAFTFLFPFGGFSFGAKTLNFISERTYQKLSTAMRIKYNDFINEGSLIVMPGTVLDVDQIYDSVVNHIYENQYEVRAIGYDPYEAKHFISKWELENGSYGIVKVPQGYATESVPLGEIKKLAEDRKIWFDQEMLQFTMGNCIIIENNNGGKKLNKLKYEDKIDAVSALMDAYIAFKTNRDYFD